MTRLLTHAEEIDLARNGNWQELVMRNQALVHSIAQKHTGYGVEFEDLFSEGMLGLVKAAQRFDPDRGCRFATYAVWKVRWECQRTIRTYYRSVHCIPLEWDVCDPFSDDDLPYIPLDLLESREREIVRRHFQLGETYREIAGTFAMSHESVRHIAKKAITKLRSNMQ